MVSLSLLSLIPHIR